MSGGVTLHASSCSEYQEEKPHKAQRYQNLRISVLFSMYSYDFLKAHNRLEVYNCDVYNKKYVYRRFITELKWAVKSKVIHDPKEIKIENVPAVHKQTDFQYEAEIDLFIFVDCSSIFKHNVCEIDWDSMTGYLSFAISEVKDHLFRGHLNNYYGKVSFVITGYHPLQPIMEAFCDLVGFPIKDPDYNFSGFIQSIKEHCWFGSFSDWLKKYDWTPEMAECALYIGNFYGGSEETEYSIACKEIKKINKEINKLKPYWKEGNGLFGQVFLDDSWIIKWKKDGGASTDRGAKGENKPIYHYNSSIYGGEFGPDGPGMSSAWNLFDGDEEPVTLYEGKYYTYGELCEIRRYFEKIRDSDPLGPRAWVGPAPKNGKAISAEVFAKEMADEQQKDFQIWEARCFNPNRKELEEHIYTIDSRQDALADSNPKEAKVWKRKSVEDEDVSDRWNAGIDEIAYHGKMVKRSYLEKKLKELQDEYNKRQNSIKSLRDYASLVTALKRITAIQFALGFVSLGASSILAAGSLLVIDSMLEIAKMGFEIKYKKDYTWDQAIEDHMSSFINNMVSALLLHSNFAKFTKKDVEDINALYKQGKAMPLKPSVKSDAQYVTQTPMQSPTEQYNKYTTTKPASNPLIATDTQVEYKTFQTSWQSLSEQYSKMVSAENKSSVLIVRIPARKIDIILDWISYVPTALRKKKNKIHRFAINTLYKIAVNDVKGDNLKYFVSPAVGRTVKDSSFLYSIYSAYDNYMFIFNPTQLKVSEAIELGIKSVDNVKAEEIFSNE